VFWNLYVRENKFSIKKQRIFLFQVFDFWFFTKIFILQQCLNPIQSLYPNPNFFFGFGSSQKIRINSDSDPQHWLTHTHFLNLFISCEQDIPYIQYTIAQQDQLIKVPANANLSLTSWICGSRLCSQLDIARYRLRYLFVCWCLRLEFCLMFSYVLTLCTSTTPVASLIVAFRRQNEMISLWKKASSQLEKHSPWEVLHYMLPFSYWLRP
jgi:hypothetical protein